MDKATMIKLHFPQDAIEYFDACYREISRNDKAMADTQRAEKAWFSADTAQKREYLEILQAVSETTGMMRNSIDMLFLLFCIEPLQEKYKEKGLSERLLLDTLQDLRYKLIECKNVYGHWGTFVLPWFRRFYLCERFALGRLQYEDVEFPYEEYKGLIKRGDKVYACHIPSCGPLLEKDVMDSLKQAYDFYKSDLRGGILPIVCHSWLLYEPFEEVFADSPNVISFRKLFDVIENKEEPTNSDFWRVFNAEYSEEKLKGFSPKTALQKNLQEYLISGNTMGCACGILLFDGEKIIK